MSVTPPEKRRGIGTPSRYDTKCLSSAFSQWFPIRRHGSKAAEAVLTPEGAT